MKLRTTLSLAAVIAAALGVFSLATAFADSNSVNFEPPTYTTGSPNGQDGWVATGSAGAGCAMYDHQIVNNAVYGTAPASFGTQSLRLSNAVTSGCFGDQTFSKPVVNEAGETTATNGGQSGGVRQNYYEAQWSFASVTPGAYQPGLSVVASPDRGDGARMSWVQMADTPQGLEVNFYDYRTTGKRFAFANVASKLDRATPHTIKITMNFLDGPSNDVVNVYVDGVLRHTGTSWEDYFRDWEPGNTSRTVDSILFRTGGDAAPETLGAGFFVDGLSNTTAAAPTVPVSAEQCKNGGWQNYTSPRSFRNQGDCMQYVNAGK